MGLGGKGVAWAGGWDGSRGVGMGVMRLDKYLG